MPVYRHTIRNFPNPENRFLFIHIPRTAGRFFTENIKSNNFELEDSFVWKSIDGVEPAHFHKEMYEKYLDVSDIPHMTIVRNPIDRFISTSIFLTRMYGDGIQELMEDPMMFGMMLENFPLTEGVNWFRPQMDFISSKTDIWKFEWGFGVDFEEWVSDLLNVKFVMKDMPYKKLTTNESKKLVKTDRLIDNIKQLYRQDIETFYPELATSLQEGAEEKT